MAVTNIKAARRIDRNSNISTVSFFADMDKLERDIILRSTTIRDYEKRHSLFLEGDSVNKFMLVLSGWVKLYNLTENGEQVVIDVVSRGDIIGDASIFTGTKAPFSASVVEKAQLAEIPSSVIKQRVWANPTLAGQIMAIMTGKINRLWIENSHLSTMKSEQLLSCLLLRLSSDMIGTGGTFSLPYDKSTIASQLGVYTSTLSRLFSKLGAKGVVCKGSEVKIDNFRALSACCCPQCPIPYEKCAGRRIAAPMFPISVEEDDLQKWA